MAKKLDLLMQEFSQTHHLSELQAQEDGSYALTIDGTISIHCQREGTGVVLLSTQLASLPETIQQAGPLVTKIMRHSYANISRYRLSLALNNQHQLSAYQRLNIGHMGNLGFTQALTRFVNHSEELSHTIARENA